MKIKNYFNQHSRAAFVIASILSSFTGYAGNEEVLSSPPEIIPSSSAKTCDGAVRPNNGFHERPSYSPSEGFSLVDQAISNLGTREVTREQPVQLVDNQNLKTKGKRHEGKDFLKPLTPADINDRIERSFIAIQKTFAFVGGASRAVARDQVGSRAAMSFGEAVRAALADPKIRAIIEELHSRNPDELAKRLMFVEHVLKALYASPLIRSIMAESVGDLAKMGIQLALNSNYRLVITIGYGGTVDGLSARVPAYVLAGVEIIEKFIQLKTEVAKGGWTIPIPRLRLISGHNAGVVANGFPVETVAVHSAMIQSVTLDYVTTFHPNAVEYVTWERDSMEHYAYPLVPVFEKLIEARLEDPSEENGPLLLSAFSSMAQNHAQAAQSRVGFYPAIHALLFLDAIPLEGPWARNDIPDGVLSIGGNPEIRFNAGRTLLLKALKADPELAQKLHFPETVMAISEVGDSPVYYKPKDGEIYVSDVCSEDGPQALKKFEHQRDIKILMEDVRKKVVAELVVAITPLKKPETHANYDSDKNFGNLVKAINDVSDFSILSGHPLLPTLLDIKKRIEHVKHDTKKKKQEMAKILEELTFERYIQFLGESTKQ